MAAPERRAHLLTGFLAMSMIAGAACVPGESSQAGAQLDRGTVPVARTDGREVRPLSATIRSALGEDAHHYAVVVKSLERGLVAEIEGDRRFYAASLFKLPIMVEAFRQREAGLLTFEDELGVTAADAALDLGTMDALGFGIGDEVSVRQLLEMMVTLSDNVSANVLYRRLGGANVDRGLRDLGLRATSVRDPELPTTAGDMATLLQAIAERRAVSPGASQEMAALLRRQALREGIPAGLPAGIAVGNKTGSWSDAAHDVAIVDAPFGTYILAVLSDLDYEAPALPAISQVVYECLAHPADGTAGEIRCASSGRAIAP